MSKLVDRIFSGTQAVAAFAIAGIAAWTFLFTPLPEVLISQLRVEIREAKSEVEDLRREKVRLQDEKERTELRVAELKLQTAKLIVDQRDLTKALKKQEMEQVRMREEISALKSTRNKLKSSINILKKERRIYAQAAVREATAKLFAIAKNRLATYEFFAKIGAGYLEHIKWLEANREFEKLLPDFSSVPITKRYTQLNPLAERVAELWRQTLSLPEIWLGEPGPPQLEPIGNPMKVKIRWGQAWLKATSLMETTERKGDAYSHYDYKAVNEYLTNFFLNDTMLGREGAEETGSTFIKGLRGEKLLQNMLFAESSRIKHLLDAFLNANPELRSIKIRLSFEKKPTVNEIVKKGKEVLGNLRHFRMKFAALGKSKR